MGKSNTIAVKVSRKMHDVLEDGARRTNMSIGGFTDHVLRMKVEGGLPLAALGENPGELPQMVKVRLTENQSLISPDGNYRLLEYLKLWSRIKQS